MYSSHQGPTANDDWRRKQKNEYEDEKENNQSSSNMSNNHQNYEQHLRDRTDLHEQPFKCNTFLFESVHNEFMAEKSPMPSSNMDFCQQNSTDKCDQTSHSTCRTNKMSRQPCSHCNATGNTSDVGSTQTKSNNSSRESHAKVDQDKSSSCGLGKENVNSKSNNEKISVDYEGARPPSETYKRNKKGSKKKHHGRSDAKPSENFKKEGGFDKNKHDIDENVNKSRHDESKNVGKEPKRPTRNRKKNISRKPDMTRRNHSSGDVDWSWVMDFHLVVLLKIGLAKIADVIPIVIKTVVSVLWYILGLLVIICFLLSWLVSVLLKIPVYLWEKISGVKADYDNFKKKEDNIHFEPRPRQQYESDLGSSEDVVLQLLSSKHHSAYDVLGVSELATDEEIKRKYREMAKIVHPDKNAHPESGEAFQILQSAFELINDEEKRMAYQVDQGREKFENDFEDFIDLMRARVNELKSKIMCSMCGKTHPRLLTDRWVYAARYCSKHGVRHFAKQGDVWVETSHLGFKYYCYLCMDGQVYEVTEWAACQGLLHQPNVNNAHEVFFSVKSNRSPWGDIFGGTEQQPYQPNNKKKRNKNKGKQSGKNKKR